MDEALLDTQALAERLGCHDRTVRKLFYDGRIRGYKVGLGRNGRLRFRASEVLADLAKPASARPRAKAKRRSA